MPIWVAISSTSWPPPASRGTCCAGATSPGPNGRAGRAGRCRVAGAFRPLRAVAGQLEPPLALRYHGHQFRSYNPELGDGRGFLFAQVARLRGRPPARPRHQGLRPHALVARRRRPADPEGRRARGAGDRHAGGAGRRPRKTFCLIETGEDLERGDEPTPTRSSVLVRLATATSASAASSASPSSSEPERMQRLLDYCDRHLLCPSLAGGRRRPRRGVPGARSAARGPHWARSGWRPASSTACSTPTT